MTATLERGLTLWGTVRERSSRAPIARASVLAWDQDAVRFGEECYPKAVTGKDGRFILEQLPRGAVAVQARASGHVPATLEEVGVPLEPSKDGAEHPGIEVLMTPGGGLTGRIVQRDRKPVRGLKLELLEEAPAVTDGKLRSGAHRVAAHPVAALLVAAHLVAIETVTEGKDGRFVSSLLVPGTYTVRLHGAWGEVTKQGVTIRGGATTDLGTIVAGPARSLSGLVTDKAGAPVEDAIVSVAWYKGSRLETHHANTTADGRYRIEMLGKAAVDLMMVSSRGFATLTRRGTPPADGRIDFVLRRDGDDPARADDLESGEISADGSAGGSRGRHQGSEAAAARSGGAKMPADPPAGGAQAGSREHAAHGGPEGSAGRGGGFDPAGIGAAGTVIAPGGGVEPAAPGAADVTTAPAQSAPRPGILTGLVLDAESQPVDRARIVVTGEMGGAAQNVETGFDGRYVLESLTPGTYQVMLHSAGGAGGVVPAPQIAFVREDQTTVVNFTSGPRIILSGRVLMGDTPLANTSITMVALGVVGRTQVKSTQSDTQGAFRIGLDHGGGYHVTAGMSVTGSSGTLSSQNLIIPDQPEVYLDIVYAVKAISGRVTGRDGSVIKGAVITATRDSRGAGDPGGQAMARSGEDGAYHVEGIDSGTYRIFARATGYQAAQVHPISVSEETPAPTVDLTLEPGWFLRGRVVDPEGNGILGALVVVASPGGAESGFLPVPTDASGAFRITAPVDGPVNVAAIPRGWAPAHLENVTAPADDRGPGILLQAGLGGSLRIRVVSRRDGVMAGVQAALRPAPLFPGSDYAMDINRPPPTDVEGASIVTRLSPGGYVITFPGRRDIAPVSVLVVEGTETGAVFTLP